MPSSTFATPLLLVLLLNIQGYGQPLLLSEAASTGCGWSGNMPGPGGTTSCPYPVSSESCPVTPSYQQLQSEGKLWPCPDYTRSTGAQFYDPNCVKGNVHALCNLDSTSPEMGCCCPQDGCWTPPYFNWIIGTCKGNGCGNYDGAPGIKKNTKMLDLTWL